MQTPNCAFDVHFFDLKFNSTFQSLFRRLPYFANRLSNVITILTLFSFVIILLTVIELQTWG